MTPAIQEVHVERLIGRKVHDREGRRVGRVHEMIVEVVDGHACVTEFHVGTGALLERVSGFISALPLFSRLPISPKEYRVGWRDLDLSDPHSPRLRRAKEELVRVGRRATSDE